MKDPEYFKTFIVGSSKGLEQNFGINLVNLGRIRHVRARDHVSDGCVIASGVSQNESATLVGQRTDARRHHGIKVTLTD